MSSRTRYGNPFPGKPIPLPLSGLFLFDPSVVTKLAGQPMRAIYTEMGKESLYKGLERCLKQNIPPTTRLLHELLTNLPPFMRDDMKAAMDGDEALRKRFDAMGAWESYFLGAQNGPEEKWPAHRRFILRIERACVEPMRLLYANRIEEVTALLTTDPLLRLFIGPETLAVFGNVRNKESLLPLQASVMLEVHLSILAAWDVALESIDSGTPQSRFHCLLPKSETQQLNPTCLFFRWLMKEAGATTIPSLFDDPRLRALSIDMVTLKRWSNGTHLPDIDWLRQASEALFGRETHEFVLRQYWATRYLNLLGYKAQQCVNKAERLVNTSNEGGLAPWPQLPFGSDSIESWFQSRYPIWLEYHRSPKGLVA